MTINDHASLPLAEGREQAIHEEAARRAVICSVRDPLDAAVSCCRDDGHDGHHEDARFIGLVWYGGRA